MHMAGVITSKTTRVHAYFCDVVYHPVKLKYLFLYNILTPLFTDVFDRIIALKTVSFEMTLWSARTFNL